MLNITDLTKSYGEIAALRGVDLTVEAGEIVALLGRNGAGKSTLLSIVAGLLRPDAGTVLVAGHDALADPAGVAGIVGIAPQTTGIFPVLSVRENLVFFGELAGISRSSRSTRVVEVADALGLAELLDRRAGGLSGGEARRLHTACAIVHGPKLLLLDEATVGADIATRQQLLETVGSLARAGTAVVYTTHYLPEVEQLEANIVIIDDGSVLAKGTQESLIAAHRLQGLRFDYDGELPPLASLAPEPVGPTTYQVLGDVDMGTLIAALGPDAMHLRSVEALTPNLETVFLAVTGKRLGILDEGDRT